MSCVFFREHTFYIYCCLLQVLSRAAQGTVHQELAMLISLVQGRLLTLGFENFDDLSSCVFVGYGCLCLCLVVYLFLSLSGLGFICVYVGGWL